MHDHLHEILRALPCMFSSPLRCAATFRALDASSSHHDYGMFRVPYFELRRFGRGDHCHEGGLEGWGGEGGKRKYKEMK
jgi:hypothetical protein